MSVIMDSTLSHLFPPFAIEFLLQKQFPLSHILCFNKVFEKTGFSDRPLAVLCIYPTDVLSI